MKFEWRMGMPHKLIGIFLSLCTIINSLPACGASATWGNMVWAQNNWPADVDVDGLADSWEITHFGNLTTANAMSDTDGDGILDIDEFIIGTDPNQDFSMNGLVAYYPLEGNAHDLSGNGHDGTEHNGVTYVSGLGSLAAEFDGINDYISVPHDAAFNTAVDDNMTVIAWIKTEALNQQHIVAKYRNTSPDGGYTLGITDVYSPIGEAYFDGRDRNAYRSAIATGSYVNNNEWHQVVGMRKGTVWSSWVDGVLINSIDTGNSNAMDNSHDFLIGARAFNGSLNFDTAFKGLIDEVRVYNRALLGEEIAAIYADADNDGTGVYLDNCPHIHNPDQLDFDRNGLGYECDSAEQSMLSAYRSQSGDVNDAPHNSTYGITCADCHTYSLWFNASPVNSTDSDFIARVDSICSPCHGFGQSYSHMKGHNKVNMGTEENEFITTAWKQSCVDCHDPHTQPQLIEHYPEDEAELYLVKGTIAGQETFTIDGDNNTTTFAYEGITAPNPNFDTPSTWQQKNDTVPGNGLIAVINPDNRDNTYRVLHADGLSIEVQGFVDPAKAGTEFALMYGQNIKAEIGGQVIKFFDPNGDYDRMPGLCNTCHTDTNIKFHDKDGLKPAHEQGTNCTTSACHSVTEGFKPPAP